MKKYRLIKKHPGSAALGTVIEVNSKGELHYPIYGIQVFLSSEALEKYSEFWEEVVENNVVFDTFGKSYYHKQSNGKWRCHGKYNQVKPIDDIEYTITAKEIGKTRYVIKEKKVKTPLFTTEDGVDIYEGDEFWFVNKSSLGSVMSGKNYVNDSRVYYFSSKQKAEEYILWNKPVLSLKDIDNISEWDGLLDKLTKIIKQRL